MVDEDVPVLIVGGSLVGLTTAMLLGHHGVASLSVERHAGTAIHPRAGHFQLRTMEVLRQLGSGAERDVRARYVVAADGNRSPMRRRLGIGMCGYGELSRSITIYFRADCADLLRDRNQGVLYVHNPKLRGFFRLDRSGGSGFLVINTVGEDAKQDPPVDLQEGILGE